MTAHRPRPTGSGFRGWVAAEDGRLVSLYGFGDWPTRGWVTAECHQHGGPVPLADCTCGINVVRDLEEMRAITRRVVGLPWVIGAVEYRGASFPGAFINGREFSDPPSTVRVRRARLRRLVVLSPEAAPLRGVLGRTLGTDVVIGATVADAPVVAPTSEDLFALVGQVAARAMNEQRINEDRDRALQELARADALMERLSAAVNEGRKEELPALRAEMLACLR